MPGRPAQQTVPLPSLLGKPHPESVRTYALADGRRLMAAEASGLETFCPTTWAGDDPVVSVATGEYTLAPRIVEHGSLRDFVALDPKYQSLCMVWAVDALAGDRHGGVFGLSNGWLAWWWREVLASTLLALVIVAVGVWFIRRRRRAWPTDVEYHSTTGGMNP